MGGTNARRVLVLFETDWDRRQFAACAPRWSDAFEIAYAEPNDCDCPASLDPIAFVAEVARRERGRIAGVMSSSDYPGAPLAGALAAELGLPGARPERVITAAHKYYSRIAQRAAAPDAVPDFALVDLRACVPAPTLAFPCFVKPVKGSFSLLARRIEDPQGFRDFVGSPAVREFGDGYMAIFNRLVAGYTDHPIDGRALIAEGVLRGDLVTVEGFACDGAIEVIGIVDSTVHANGSFARFDYPSALPAHVQDRMSDVARRVIAELGLDQALWNIEMMYDARADRVSIIEVNPRICGQFADLYQKVDGTNSYEIALALCTGTRPHFAPRRGRYAAAASFPLRVFEPSAVLAAPDDADAAAAEALYPETLVWRECAKGEELADFAGEDGASQRYAVINLGGAGRADLGRRCRAVEKRLGFCFGPLRAR
ncbi:MAG TPA: ATP-grasp domain-containing protein [Myxococcota bacterium]|nr:ATP-grasp domain-containing protein [Myxococcota bacterium]